MERFRFVIITGMSGCGENEFHAEAGRYGVLLCG